MGDRMLSSATPNDATKRISQDIRSLAEEISILASGLRLRDPELARNALAEAREFLADDGSGAAKGANVVNLNNKSAQSDQENPIESENLSEFIVTIAKDRNTILSVQQIFEFVEDAGYTIQRPSLVVKLHRLVDSGFLVSPSRGHFRISDSALNNNSKSRSL